MLCKLLLCLAALFSYHGYGNAKQQEEFVPTPYGPQSFKAEDIARKALYGKHYGGDMIFPGDFNKSDAGVKSRRFRWRGYPGGAVVPYVLDPSVSSFRKVILQGMEAYHNQTCIRFVPRKKQKDYITIFYGQGCYSVIGRAGGEQDLSLGEGCDYVGLVIHELGHAIGLFHEHQRADRDEYLTIFFDNVEPDQLHNFSLNDPDREINVTPYDYNSIMHYGNYAFSREPYWSPTMVAKNGHKLYEPYEKSGFTKSDLMTIKKLYKC